MSQSNTKGQKVDVRVSQISPAHLMILISGWCQNLARGKKRILDPRILWILLDPVDPIDRFGSYGSFWILLDPFGSCQILLGPYKNFLTFSGSYLLVKTLISHSNQFLMSHWLVQYELLTTSAIIFLTPASKKTGWFLQESIENCRK